MYVSIERILNKYFDAFFLFLFLCISIYYKVYLIQNHIIFGDDAFSIFHAQKSLNELIKVLSTDRNPPLYFIILHGWIKLFGIGAFQVKVLSSIFSILTFVALYIFSKQYFNRLTAFFTSITFFFSDVHFDYAFEVRAYPLVLLLTIVSSYYFFNLIHQKKIKNIVILSLVNLSLLFTHYITIFFIISQLLASVFFILRDRSLLKYICISYFITALFYLPYVGVVINNLPTTKRFWLQEPTFQDLQFVFLKLCEDYVLQNVYMFILIISCIFYLIKDKIQNITTIPWEKYLFGCILFIFPVISCFITAKFTPIFQLKYVLFSSFGVIISTGYFISKLCLPNFLKVLFIIPFIGWNIYHFDPTQRISENWKSTAEMVQTQKTPNTLTIICAAYKSIDFCYYYNPSYFKDYKKTINNLLSEHIIPVYTIRDLDNISFENIDKVIYIDSHRKVVDPNNSVYQFLESKYPLSENHRQGTDINITIFK